MLLDVAPAQQYNVVERIRGIMEGVRADGTHVSELTGCLRKAWWKRNNYTPPIDPGTVLLFATGRAIQDYITGGTAEEVERPIVVDGIHGTPDYHDAEDAIWEVKATYTSAAKDVLDTPHYFDQMAAYAAMEGKLEAYLAVYYLNGYYNWQRKKGNQLGSPGERSVLKVFHAVYTAEELTEHWDRMKGRADILNGAKEFTDIPIALHYSWECQYCPLLYDVCPGGDGGYRNHWMDDRGVYE